MASEPVIIRPVDRLLTPLVYNDSIDTTNMTNVVLIDSIIVNNKQFYDSANANTFPIIYNYNSSTSDLIALLRQKFPTSSIQRIALVFHDKGFNFTTPFMNEKRLFEESDLEENQTSFTENVSFLISCIKEFHVGYIDYLACNTLQYSNWKSYYALLVLQTSVVVGASNNKTGNINYGGDWVMENTNENVRDLYFTANISEYASTLTLTIIPLDGANGDVELDMSNNEIRYSQLPAIDWTPIGSGNWPVQFNNSNLSSTLKIVAIENLTITNSYGGTSGYFIAGTNNITFDGSGNTITLDTITGYPGFIENGTVVQTGKVDIIVQNFITATSGGSTLASRAGWLCQEDFGAGVLGNQIISCTNTGAINASQSGGIAGSYAGYGVGCSISFTSCTNTGQISGSGSGGIAGHIVAGDSGTATFMNCTNSGLISGGDYAGGIVGQYCAGTSSFMNCTNTGQISSSGSGGIAGAQAGSEPGSAVTFTSCTNTGPISNSGSGGIAGYAAGTNGGSVEFTGCINSGIISGNFSGGIGPNDITNANITNCFNSGTIIGMGAGGIVSNSLNSSTITSCTNIGDISGEIAGGIASWQVGYNSNGTCTINQCYSTGAISGSNAGGIVGAEVGYTTDSTTSIVNITNCYSLGAISSSAGGICGGSSFGTYSVPPIVNITNCYSWGLVTDAGSGIVALGLQITPTQYNTYVADGDWTDASANEMIYGLTGTPASINIGNNPGMTWTKIANNTTTPYMLSSFNEQIYIPNSASSSSSYYTTDPGVFLDSSYNLLDKTQASNVATALVFVAKGSTPYYYSYNTNTFEFTNSNPATSTESIDVNINSSTGALNLIVACFKKGTKILCENDLYIPVEDLKIGDLVKTYKHGYRKVIMCSHSSLCEHSQKRFNKLYTYSREKNADLIEDLHLTGGHSLLLDTLTEEESNDMKQIPWPLDELVVEDKYKLLACFSSQLYVATEQNAEVYHFALEPPENATLGHVYGIYANGILAETCSQYAMKAILGEK